MMHRKWKHWLCLFLMMAGIFALSRGTFAAAAQGNVIYLSGQVESSGDGLTPEGAVKTLEEALGKMSGGGTIVVCGDVEVNSPDNPTRYTWTATDKITVTGKDGDKDYAPTIRFTGKKTVIDCASEIEFNHLTLNHEATGCTEFYAGPSLTFGENVTFLHEGKDITTSQNGWIAIRLGNYTAACENSAVELFSGKLSYIQGGNNKKPVTNSTVILHPGVELTDFLQCGGTNKNVTGSDVRIDGAKITTLYLNGHGTAQMGTVSVLAENAEIGEILYNRNGSGTPTCGGISLTLDRTVFSSLCNIDDSLVTGTAGLTLKNYDSLTLTKDLSGWDELTLEKSVVHLTAVYAGPAGAVGDADSRLLVDKANYPDGLPVIGNIAVEYADEDEPTELLKEVYLDASAPDGGNGTADSPVNTMEKAFALLDSGEGTIWLVGEYKNYTGKGTYIFPDHDGKVTIAGTDESAKINFCASGKTLVQFRCPVELKNLTYEYRHDGGNMDIYAGQELMIGENVTFFCTAQQGMGGNCIAVRGGYYDPADETYRSAHCAHHDTKISMMSGTISYVMGGNGRNEAGNVEINFGGSAAVVARLQGSGANGHGLESYRLVISGGTIPELVINGHEDTRIKNDSSIMISGGTISKIITNRTDNQSQMSGNFSLEITGDVSIGSIDLTGSMVAAEKAQTLKFAGGGTISVGEGFGDGWDTVTVGENTSVKLAGTYPALPDTVLRVEDGGVLYLNSNTNEAEPACEKSGAAGTGKVVLEVMHEVKYVAAKEPGELIGGYKEHYQCGICGKYFADGEAAVELDWEKDLYLPPLGGYQFHDYVEGSNYSMTHLMSYGSGGQGSAVYGDTLLICTNQGLCRMFDLRSGRFVTQFPLGSYNTGTAPDGTADKAWTNHANQMMFGPDKFEESDPFPLLYVTTGNSGNHDTGGAYIAKCAVERIRYSEENGWYSELVQTIEFNDAANIPDAAIDGVLTRMYKDGKFTYVSGNGYDAAKGYEKVGWGWAASFVDSDPTEATAGKFYLKGARFRTTEAMEKTNQADYGITDYWTDSAYLVTEFDLPGLPSSEADPAYGGTVTLYPRDITDQFITEYDIGFTQGGMMYQGRIYYSYGCMGAPDNLYKRNGIQVFDIAEKKIVSKLPLYLHSSWNYEPECTSVWNGNLVLTMNGGAGTEVYLFNYIALDEEKVVEGTCTEDGYSYIECSLCGHHLKETVNADSKLPHQLTKTEAKAATCAEDGNIEYYTCGVCGKNFLDAAGTTEAGEVAVKATGHQLTKTEAKAATCTEDGNIGYYTCGVCKKNFLDAAGTTEAGEVMLKAVGHSLTRVEAKAATATEDGNIEYYICETCGKWFRTVDGATEITREDTIIKATGSAEPVPDDGNEQDDPETPEDQTPAPGTGDIANPGLWAGLMLLSGAGAAALKKKKEKTDK